MFLAPHLNFLAPHLNFGKFLEKGSVFPLDVNNVNIQVNLDKIWDGSRDP